MTSFDPTAVRDALEILHGRSAGWVNVAYVSAAAAYRPGKWYDTTDRGWITKAVAYARWCDEQDAAGIYVRMTSVRQAPEKGRGSAGDSLTLPALWADIDCAGDGHRFDPAKHGGLRLTADEDEARELVAASGLPEPSCWVATGGGFYPWWIIDPVIDLADPITRAEVSITTAEATAERWHTVLARTAVARGLFVDNTSDLARVLRLPGTVNRKRAMAEAIGPQDCRVISESERTYTWGELCDALDVAYAALPAELTPQPEAPPRAPYSGAARPGDDFNARVDWADTLLLGGLGWTVTRQGRGGYREWRHPDASYDKSATTGHERDADRLYVFTSSTIFEQQRPYDKLGAYALIHHRGDISAATAELRRLGYGDPLVAVREQYDWAGAEPRVTTPRPEQGAARPSIDNADHAADDSSVADAQRPRRGTSDTGIGLASGGAASSSAITSAVGAHRQSPPSVGSPDSTDSATGASTAPPITVPPGGNGERVNESPAERPQIDLTDEPAAVRALGALLCDGLAPDAYVRGGQLVQLTRHDGDTALDALHIDPVTPHTLRRIVAERAVSYTFTARGARPKLPAVETASTVLSATEWPGVRQLVGVTAMPVVRPDGRLLTTRGYDSGTRLFYAPRLELKPVPDEPTPADVAAAKILLLEHVLADFPWDSAASRANYVALLLTPILRPYLGGLAPFGAISATIAGSGKTLLGEDIMRHLYTVEQQTWNDDDTEMRKAITSILINTTAPVVSFDNLGDHSVIKQPSLSRLLTAEQWGDRLLGGNTIGHGVNNRLWLATGNNLAIGGDMAPRTVLVRLDPRMPRPDLRTEWRLGANLSAWLADDANCAELLHALLVLCRAWTAAGAPRAEYVMRNFTPWACALGGLLHHHGISGFLANADELAEHDDDVATWAGFLREWHTRFGERWVSATEVRASAEPVFAFGMPSADPWAGRFLTDVKGNPASAKSLGKQIKARHGQFFGALRVETKYDTHQCSSLYRVIPYTPDASE